VGLAAVQAARIKGAERIVAAGRRPEGLAEARKVGAHETVRLDRDDLAGALTEAAGGDGPTVVIDPLWGEPLVAATEAAAPGARFVQVGQSAGPNATLTSGVVRGKQLEIYGYSNFVVPAEARRSAYLELVSHAARGELEFPAETYPLERVGEAWERQVNGPGAKLVIRLN
jgi:NADPH2:quinone reductase